MDKINEILKPYIQAYHEGFEEEINNEIKQAKHQLISSLIDGLPKKTEIDKSFGVHITEIFTMRNQTLSEVEQYLRKLTEGGK